MRYLSCLYRAILHRDPAARGLLLRAIVVVFLARMAMLTLRRTALRRTADLLGTGLVRRLLVVPVEDDRELVLDRFCWAVQAAARCVPGAKCLPKAFALWAFMNRNGLPGEAVIGITFRGGEIQPLGHAWVELGARVIGEDGLAAKGCREVVRFGPTTDGCAVPR